MTRIKTLYLSQIDEASERFGDHEGIDPARIVRWLMNFEEEHLEIAVRLLGAINYYGASRVRAMTKELVKMVLQDFEGMEAKDIYFVNIGRGGDSANVILRILRHLPERGDAKIITMVDLEKLAVNKDSVLVFVDDFSGTGDQLKEWWESVESLVRPKDACIVVALLVMNERARGEIEEFADCVLCVDELSSKKNVLIPENGDLEPSDREVVLAYCGKTGCEEAFVRGYGECGLLLAFKHGCPDNSLPVLWWDSSEWSYLFRRSAI